MYELRGRWARVVTKSICFTSLMRIMRKGRVAFVMRYVKQSSSTTVIEPVHNAIRNSMFTHLFIISTDLSSGRTGCYTLHNTDERWMLSILKCKRNRMMKSLCSYISYENKTDCRNVWFQSLSIPTRINLQSSKNQGRKTKWTTHTITGIDGKHINREMEIH